MRFAQFALSLLLGGAAGSRRRNQSQPPPELGARAAEATCPPNSRVVLELLPTCYTKAFTSTTVVDPFGNGEFLTITRVPTTVIVTFMQTKVIEASTSGSDSGWVTIKPPEVDSSLPPLFPERTLTRGTGTAGGTSAASTRTAGSSGGNGGSTRRNEGSTGGDGSATSRSSTRSGNSNSGSATGTATRSNTGLTTGTGPPVVSGSSGTIITSPATSSSLLLGAGVPTGVVTDLPDGDFIILAISPSSTNPIQPTGAPMAPDPDDRAWLVRRQAEGLEDDAEIPAAAAPPESRPLKVVDFDHTEGVADTVSRDQCDSADTLVLREGKLVRYDYSVGKPMDDTLAQLGFLIPSPRNFVNLRFALLDGILQWVAPDVGAAVFFSCNGQVVAAFQGMMPAGCSQVVVGAIGGKACYSRVQSTRSPDASFTAPTGTPPSVPVQQSTYTPSVSETTPGATTSASSAVSTSTDLSESSGFSISTSRLGNSSIPLTPTGSDPISSTSTGVEGTPTPSETASITSSQVSSSESSSSESSSSATSTTAGCDPPFQTPDSAINSRMAEALRTGNPDLVTQDELYRQIQASLDGRRNFAYDIVPNDTTVTWLLDPNTGYVRNPGPLTALLIGNRNTVEPSTPNPANKTLAAIGAAAGFDARMAYFGGNPLITNDAGTATWRPATDEGLRLTVQNTVRYLVPIDTCNGPTQAPDFSDLNIVLSMAKNGAAETATLKSLNTTFPGAVVNGGKTAANACDFVAGQSNSCLAGANLLIVGDDIAVGDDTIAQQIVDAHKAGLALFVMTENGNPYPLSSKIAVLLGFGTAQNYFGGRTVIEQATKEYLVPDSVISDQYTADALTFRQYLRDDPLVPADYAACVGGPDSSIYVGDIALKDCIEKPPAGVSTRARPYFAALTRFRVIFDGLSGSGIDMFNATYGSQTETLRVLTLIADKYRRGPGPQSGDTAVAISYPVDLKGDGAASGRSFFADWLSPRTTKATGRAKSLGSLYCITRKIAETDIASCQSPKFPNVGNYPLTLRSTRDDRFTATGFDIVPGSAATVTLQSDPGFPVYIRFGPGQDPQTRAFLRPQADAISDYNRPGFGQGPFVRLMPNVPVTINTPYGGPLYVRQRATSANAPTDMQFTFSNVARHPALFYPATDAEFDSFVEEVSTSEAYWADIVDDAFEIHSPIALLKSAQTPNGLSVQATPRRTYYNGSDGLALLVQDFRDSWAAEEYRLAGLKIRSQPLSDTLSADDKRICADLGFPCLNETLNTRVDHQHVTYDSFASCGGLCSGNPITIADVPMPLDYGTGHELGHNLQRFQLGIFWPDTSNGANMAKINSWANYVRRDGEVSNNIFPFNNIYQYFRYTAPARAGKSPDNGIMGDRDKRKDPDVFSGYISAYGNLTLNGRRVILDATCTLIGTYPIDTPPAVALANAFWGNGAYAVNQGVRVAFYFSLPDLLQGRKMSNGVTLTDGRDIYTLLYQAARAFSSYAVKEETWLAGRASLGLSLYDFQDTAVYGTGKTVNDMIGNDFLLVLLCYITGYDFRPYFASRGVFYTSRANDQVKANFAAGPGSRDLGRPFLTFNTQMPQVNRTAVLGTSANAYKRNDVYFDATDTTVTWPGSDDNRDGTPESLIGFTPRNCAGVVSGS